MSTSTEKETYFSHQDRMFPLLEGGKIPTEQFLKACQGIADFVGFLGAAFGPVRTDISGNVNKVKTKFETDKERLKYLQTLVDVDLSEHNGKMGMATEGLLWLKRGLEFMLELLKHLVHIYNQSKATNTLSSTENISHILRGAYDKSLKRHHNFLSKQLFKVVIHAAPYRKDILKALAYGNVELEEVCVHHISELLGNFAQNVKTLVDYYYEKKLESHPPSNN